MGVAGSGKTTVGVELAGALDRRFVDADDLHPKANVDKMAAGHPLDDADRRPWLDAVRAVLTADRTVVVACSALKRRYRDRLRSGGDVTFAYLNIDAATASTRISQRQGHFMGAEMVASQFAALEPPGSDEADVLVVNGARTVGEIVEALVATLGDSRGRD